MKRKLLLIFICFITFSFANAQLNSVAIVGPGAGGWPGAGTDTNQMTTTDGGLNWTITNLILTNGPVKFRANNEWNPTANWGGTTFPSGTGTVDGSAITAVAGVYNVFFNTSTLTYTFAPISVAIVGEGAGGWPANTPNEVDAHQMATTDGENWSISNITLTNGAVKFRGNNSWSPFDWGGTSFPNGTAVLALQDAVTAEAGVYTFNFNSRTRAYSFSKNLAVKGFDATTFTTYPNPTQNNWTFNSSLEDIQSITILDATGKTVKTLTPKSNIITVDASTLSNGVYFAKVTTSATQTLKLVKQ